MEMGRFRSSMGHSAGRRSLAVAAMLCLGAMLPSAAWSLSFDEQIQGLTVTPFLSERVEYDSNVFQTPSGTRGDMITRTIPGFIADLSRGSLAASVGYRAEFVNYLTLTGQNTTNQVAVVQLKLDMARLKLQLRDDFIESTDPPGSELTGPIKSQTNVFAPTAEYRLTERFSVALYYAWTHIHYPATSAGADAPNAQQNQAVQQLDENDQTAGGTVWWKVLSKSDVGLSLQYGRQSFQNDPSRDTQREIVSVSVRGDLTAKLSSTAKIGIEHREATSTAPAFTGFIASGGWTFQPSDRTQYTLTSDRSPQESIFESAQYYVSTSMTVGVRHEFPARKLAAWFRTGAGQDEYNTKQVTQNTVTTKYRLDTFVGAAGGLDYVIQPWLRTGVEYSFKQRTSNFPQFNYDDSRISGRITLQF